MIITSGIGRKPGQSRIDLAQTNVNIMKDIAPKIAAVAPNALYVIVSNPVDIMTYVFTKVSGIPENQVIGSGAIMAFTMSLDDFVISYFVSGLDFVTLPVEIYSYTKKPLHPKIYALFTLLFLLILVLMVTMNLIQLRGDKKRAAAHSGV